MSREIYEQGGLYVTRFACPASECPDRRRWQFTIPASQEYVQLDAEGLAALLRAVFDDLREGDPDAAVWL